MEKILFAFLAAFLLTSAAAAQKAETIDWKLDYQAAQALSRETGKPLLLDFTAVWCEPCRFMDEHFWARADVVETMKSFVAVKLDYDKERRLAGRFRVRGLPYIAFADPIGNLITYRKGFGTKNADELKQIFTELPKDFSPIKQDYDAVESNKNDGLALLKIADFYQNAGMLVLSNDFYKRANRSYAVNKNAETRERIAAAIGLNFYAAKDYVQANQALEEYLKIFPAGKYEESSVAALAVGYANLGKLKEAEIHLTILKTKFPNSKELPATTAKVLEQTKSNSKK